MLRRFTKPLKVSEWRLKFSRILESIESVVATQKALEYIIMMDRNVFGSLESIDKVAAIHEDVAVEAEVCLDVLESVERVLAAKKKFERPVA